MSNTDQNDAERVVFWVLGAVVTILLGALIWWKVMSNAPVMQSAAIIAANDTPVEAAPAEITPVPSTPPVGDDLPKNLGEMDLTVADGTLTLTGAVPTERKKSRLLSQAALVFGAAKVVDQLRVEETAAMPNWKGKTIDLMAKLATLGNFQLGLKDNQINVNAKVADDGVKAAWIDWFANFFVDQPLQVNAENMVVDASLPPVINFDVSTLFNVRVNFASGSAEIPEADKPGLDQVAEFLIEDNASLRIVGHTDSTGDADANQTLSNDRASSVANYLTSKGVPPQIMSAYGMGQNQPIAENETEAGRAQNRRIEFAR
jgi:outer membrane protein OmpA-like peptidoglycan-associated protein